MNKLFTFATRPQNVQKIAQKLYYPAWIVSLSQGGEGLGTMWGIAKAKKYIKKAGFTNVTVKTLPHDVMNAYFLISK